jgi:hypothetical protein
MAAGWEDGSSRRLRERGTRYNNLFAIFCTGHCSRRAKRRIFDLYVPNPLAIWAAVRNFPVVIMV